MRPTHLALAALVFAALGACRPSPESLAEKSPLDSLASPEESRRYDLEFWTREAHRHTPLWTAGLRTCAPPRTGDGYPNCRLIRLAGFLDRPPVLPPLPVPGEKPGAAR